MKKKLSLIFFLACAATVYPQNKLTLEECYQRARKNYPLIKQKEYIAESKDYSVSNIWKGYFPQITISGQATYQSDVTSLPISFPGLTIESLTKEQYKAVAEITQTVFDGGVMSSQASIQRAATEIDDQKVEVEFLKVKERINQIYFGILLLHGQLIQTDLIKRDLNASLLKMNAALENGTTSRMNVDVLKSELLKVDQREIELKSSRKSYVEMLGLLINLKLEETVMLELPEDQTILDGEVLNRPELKLYSSQEKLIESQNGLLLAKILPKANLFFQGGYGKPTLNMLENEFDWYYTAGARLTWQLSNFYTYGNENEITELNKKIVETQKETFLLNTDLLLNQQSSEINKLRKLIKVDEEIIKIRISVKDAAQSQLENGVITSNDFIRELNAEDQAKQNLVIHKIQLLLAQHNHKLTLGN
ncbi:MAG: TolC family protein [Bacteroidota bacterium]